MGRAGVVLRWDGHRWSREDAGTDEDLYGVWADDSEVIAVGGNLAVGGQSLVVTHRSGRWSQQRSGLQSLLLSVAGAGGLARAVGFNGGVVERTPDGWREIVALATNEHLFCVRRHQDTWLICGLNGTLVGATGTTSAHLTSLVPGLVVGFDGTILRDGQVLVSPTREHLWGVTGTARDAIAVGARGTMLAIRDDVVLLPGVTTEDLHGVSRADGLALAVGRRGVCVRIPLHGASDPALRPA